jgi:hypothetical protein
MATLGVVGGLIVVGGYVFLFPFIEGSSPDKDKKV